MELLDELKALWFSNRERMKFNPMMREIRELIRKHDPNWDDQSALRTSPKFDIFMPGADRPTST